MDLREHTLRLQRIENDACEKAGMRMRLVDDSALVSKDGEDYRRELVEAVLLDIAEDAKRAARLGVELGEAIVKAQAASAKDSE